MARPSKYSRAVVERICERLACGHSLTRICRDPKMPSMSMVMRWLDKHTEFREQYARAREIQADTLADEILDIADDGQNDTYPIDGTGATGVNHDVIARSRLRVDARKWYASKLAPKKYGEMVKQEITGADDGPLIVEIVRYAPDKPAE
ncbi:hypothetical protein [Chromobacterium subtsugae]|uniref:terminase small subunit-like protein n=1 Tax=Chromobacterium subtsugae TaxID=251747 RepID=UPI0007F88203|nr:hypothetical protein [Chromobacterium subtsugae]OBU84574.1 hypothetical protein MY55_21320 [Chromobacterium subtsugae]